MLDFGDIALAVFVAAALVLALLGGLTLTNDVRSFDGVAKACKERGFIQDKTTRIVCHVEARP